MLLKKSFLCVIFFLSVAFSVDAQQNNHSNSVNILYEHVFLEGERADWNLGQLWYEQRSEYLTSIFRLNYADRFNQNAYETEIGLYPQFSENTYAHLAAGVSLTQEGFFPDFSFRTNLYQNLTKTLVGGFGLRYQSFEIGDAFIYNAGLRWYLKDFLFMGQSFFQKADDKLLATGVLTVRKYLTYPTFIYAKIAYGQSPQGLRFEEDVINTFNSFFMALGGDFLLYDRFIFAPSVNFRDSRYNSNTSRYRIGVSGRLSYRF